MKVYGTTCYYCAEEIDENPITYYFDNELKNDVPVCESCRLELFKDQKPKFELEGNDCSKDCIDCGGCMED